MSGIRPTPILTGKAADEFLRRMKEKEDHKPTKEEKEELDKLMKKLDKMPSSCEGCKSKDLQISVMEMEIQSYRDLIKTAVNYLQKYMDLTKLDD